MTPTEQDKELRDKVITIVEYWDFSPLQDEDSRIERLENEIMQLITSDRKRVALESEMNAWKQVRKSYPKKQTLQGNAVSRLTLADVDRKITELKAQQEKAK